MTPRLPFDAELVRAKNRRFDETVVFVHHFGGSRRTVLRHVRMVNDLGYDAIRFDLIFHKNKPNEQLPITGDLHWGVRYVWANQLESILNAIPGRKIIYAFSMPAASAIQAIARRKNADVVGLVCDGGPFMQLVRCMWNLYEQGYQIQSKVARAGFTGAAFLLWGLRFKKEMKSALANLPKGFPVLSIRGGKDTLVPESAVDDFFKLQRHLDLETLSLPEAGHLSGLRDFPGEYIPRVEAFLQRITAEVPSATSFSPKSV